MAHSISGARSSATQSSAERIHQHLPPNSNMTPPSPSNRLSRSGSGLNRHSSRPKERPSSSSSSSSATASNAGVRRSISVSPNHHRVVSKDVDDDNDPGRVRVSVRLRPRNSEELISDADFPDLVELQPELKRLKLRKNNWSSESYRFDEVFTETASQKRVYEVVSKPVVEVSKQQAKEASESVLNGYNGTIMAYGQTGTGKTYTVGKLGEKDASERGIMVRALEDIISNTSSVSDTIEVSYLQLYMESLQDLLAPEKNNITISEDSKTGEVSLLGATIVKIQDLDHFMQLLQIGEANRHLANTKLNTESSRSHAVLTVHLRRSINDKAGDEIKDQDKQSNINLLGDKGIPMVRKSKLLIVDLAGSERIGKSGGDSHSIEEAKFINLSLSSLGKCINALAENCSHIPTRDSKLTRLLRDSFGGSARTSLIITIGPSVRFHGETSGTIMFGQRAMKVVNMIKLKEEFDYESLCRKLETQVDHLTAEVERQQELRETEKHDMEKRWRECSRTFSEAEQKLLTRSEFLEKENTQLERKLKDTLNEFNSKQDETSLMRDRVVQLELSLKHSQKLLADTTKRQEKKVADLIRQLEVEQDRTKSTEQRLDEMKKLLSRQKKSIQETLSEELHDLKQRLAEEEGRRKTIEYELIKLKTIVPENYNAFEDKEAYIREEIHKGPKALMKKTLSDQRLTVAKLCEEVGIQKILQLLASEDSEVQMHAVKVVANLAAEETNQVKIVDEGGLDALLALLKSSQDPTILRVTSGAIANLAMNERNQILIMGKEGGQLLAKAASKTEDPQTLRMVAGALANLCGNEKLLMKLVEDEGIKALLSTVRCANIDVIAQVARGMANFAKCESREVFQGYRKVRSLLIEDGVFEWLISNPSITSPSARCHVELALCHLAQNEYNANDFISRGGVKELIRISVESSREDIRNLAKKILKSNSALELKNT